MSAYGTKRTFLDVRLMFALGGKANVAQTASDDRYDPKRKRRSRANGTEQITTHLSVLIRQRGLMKSLNTLTALRLAFLSRGRQSSR
jgi:hypothetical protein